MDCIDRILLSFMFGCIFIIIIAQNHLADKRFLSFLELERKVELLERKVEVLRTLNKITPNGY